MSEQQSVKSINVLFYVCSQRGDIRQPTTTTPNRNICYTGFSLDFPSSLFKTEVSKSRKHDRECCHFVPSKSVLVTAWTRPVIVFILFYPEVKNLKLCPFVTNNLSQILSTSQTFNYCWPLLKLPLAFLLTSHGRLSLTMVSSKGWRWVFWLCPVILFCYQRPKCYELPT